MRLLIDARKAGDGGIGVYLDNLISGLSELRADGIINIECVLLVAPLGSSSDTDLRETVSRWAEHWECIEECAGKYSISEYFDLARRHRSLLKRVDLFHSPHYTLPFFLPVPKIVTIHDVIHLQYPERLATRLVAGPLIRSAVRRADAIVTVSARSQQTLSQYVGGGTAPIYVVPNAVTERFFPTTGAESRQRAAQFQQPYCLFLGSDRLHKGFDMLLECWTRLLSTVDQPLADSIELVVLGSRFAGQARAEVARRGLKGRVRFLGQVSAAALPQLYHGAEAVVVSSREEGFGLPALEAMASGTTLVSTPLPSVREICGDAAWYSDTFDGEALCRALDAALRAGALRQEKQQLGIERAREFSVSSKARQTCAIYEAVLRGCGRVKGSVWTETTHQSQPRLRTASGVG